MENGRIMECAEMSALWHWETCLPVGKRSRHGGIAAVQRSRRSGSPICPMRPLRPMQPNSMFPATDNRLLTNDKKETTDFAMAGTNPESK